MINHISYYGAKCSNRQLNALYERRGHDWQITVLLIRFKSDTSMKCSFDNDAQNICLNSITFWARLDNYILCEINEDIKIGDMTLTLL